MCYKLNLPPPVGALLAYYSDPSNIPPGWLLCDGRDFSTTEYPGLQDAIGRSTVPDLRGYFLRGLDATGTIDPDKDRKIGSIQENRFTGQVAGSGAELVLSIESNGPISMNGRAATETRPDNVAIHYLIYAGQPANGGNQ